MNPTENQFLKDLDKRLWTAADKLRSNLDAAVYKHVVLGLIFLKYVSDASNEATRYSQPCATCCRQHLYLASHMRRVRNDSSKG